MATRTSGEPRIPLSTERVLRAAIELADEGGLESLSMRRLGQRLGVEAMSLYNHVANKDDVLSGIVDLVVGEFSIPDDVSDWKAALRQIYTSANKVLTRHPWACTLMMTASGVGPWRKRYMESVLGALRQAGCSVELTHLGFHALDVHLLGYTIQVSSFRSLPEDLGEMGARFLRDLPEDDYPFLAEHVRHHLEEDHGSEFWFGLELVLDGIERRRDAQATPISPP